jgi:hypothetical protein
MTKRWLRVALLASWLGPVTLAPAQYLYNQVGAARMGDPAPVAPSTSGKPQPPLVDGPISPLQAPPGPPSCINLPANHDGAFVCEEPQPDEGIYVSIGTLTLKREFLKDLGIAFIDRTSGGIDTGISSQTPPAAINNKDLGHPYNFGITGTLGYFWNSYAVEASGFYISESTKGLSTVAPGLLNVPFVNAPQGFGGDNGLWLQADRVSTTFRSNLASAEINCRYCNRAFIDMQLLCGVRYLDLRENLSILTDDDGILNPLGLDQATLGSFQATYTVQTHNHVVVPQIGFEADRSVTPYFTLGLIGKAGLGANFIDSSASLVRGDNFPGFTAKSSDINYVTQVYDLCAYVDFNVLQRVHLHLGYDALWVIGVATSAEQLNFDLSNPAPQKRHSDSAFFHGPMAELQILF